MDIETKWGMILMVGIVVGSIIAIWYFSDIAIDRCAIAIEGYRQIGLTFTDEMLKENHPTVQAWSKSFDKIRREC